jgi:hypothetical protein
MNKKQLSIISVVFVLSILVAGCSPDEEISPSSRLVGHWEAAYERDGTLGEIYLGQLSTDGKGKLYMTFDYANYCERTYEIISENEDTYTVRFFRDYTPKYEDFSFEFRDDSFMRWKDKDGDLIKEFTYIDSETEPDNLSTLAEKENEYPITTSLTGHWIPINEADGEIDESWHVYFGRINEDGEGIYYEIGEDSPDFKLTYKIVNQDGKNYDLQTTLECGGYEFSDRLEVSDDGQILTSPQEDRVVRLKYIDSKTEP